MNLSTPTRPPSAHGTLRLLCGLFLTAQALFWTAWWAGFRWLPEGWLRGKSVAGQLPLEQWGLVPMIGGIILWNALYAGLFVAGANLLRVVTLPLGFVPALAAWAMYGLILGTNSFATPLPVRPAPDPGLVLQRSGFYELSAYLLVAAATARWSRWQQHGWLTGPTTRLRPRPLGRASAALLVLALVIIAGAAIREGLMWHAALGGTNSPG